ncbi:MAG: hypothetical protein AB7O97_05440, partial [Planctomycetota bacterium]
RLEIDPVTGEVVPTAMSEALGHGAWALCVSEAKLEPGDEILVATYRGLHILDRFGLQTKASRRDLDWELFRPTSIQVADVIPGGFSEIFVCSDPGVIAVFDTDLNELGRFVEPGVVDMKVVGVHDQKVELALLSHRGFVVRVLWEIQSDSVEVLAVSPRFNGIPGDMEFRAGGTELVVLLADTHAGHNECLWVLDAGTLAPTSAPASWQITRSFANGQNTPDPQYGAGGDLEVVEAPGLEGFVLLKSERLIHVPYPSAGTEQQIRVLDYPPMMRPLDVVTLGDKLLVSTEAGYVCWLPLADLQGGLSFGSPTTRSAGVANGAPSHCNRTLSGTWGMAVHPGDPTGSPPVPPTLHGIDQAGSRWSVGAAGDVTLVGESAIRGVGTPPNATVMPQAGPFRTMRYAPWVAGSTSTAAEANVLDVTQPTPPSSGGPANGFLSPSPTTVIETAPWVPFDPTNPAAEISYPGNPNVPWARDLTFSIPHRLYAYDGFAVFARSGDALEAPGPSGTTRHLCWWSGDHYPNNYWPDRVQGFYSADPVLPATQSTIPIWWSSTGTATPGSQTTGDQIFGHTLRNHLIEPSPRSDAQALRLFVDPEPAANGAHRVAVTTAGGRLLVLDAGTNGTDIGDAPLELDQASGNVLDYGSWCTALEIVSRGTPLADLYMAPMAYYTARTNHHDPLQDETTPADDLVSAIVRVEYLGAATFSNATLSQREITVLDGGSANRPKVFGVCGMAAGQLPEPTTGQPRDVLVVGALDGHLLIYETLPTGGLGNLLYATQVEGSVGNYNSIVFADLDQDGENELYVAGSLGLRRWVR